MGIVKAISISRKKGTVKREIPVARFEAQHGIVGDAHAGPWHRQVSLLAEESFLSVRSLLPGLAVGAFAENLLISGLEPASIHLGDRLYLGPEVVLEVTQIGKECHTACAIRSIVGDCIMPREGIFCRVLQGGEVTKGMPVRVRAAEQAGSSREPKRPAAVESISSNREILC